MNKEAWMKLATGLTSIACTISLAWLCWTSSTVVAHGQALAALEARCESFRRSDDEQRVMLSEIREDIKKLLARK